MGGHPPPRKLERRRTHWKNYERKREQAPFSPLILILEKKKILKSPAVPFFH